MTAMTYFLYNSLSKSLKYDTWLLGAISLKIPYQNHWNMTYDCYGQFPLQFLIKLLKYATWQLGAISFTIPYQNRWKMIYDCYDPFPLQLLIKIIEILDLTARSQFPYNPLSKALKYDLWQLWAISFTIHYQNHWNMNYGSYELCPLQFLIKIIEICPMTDMDHLLYNSTSRSLKYELWLLGTIFCTIPYHNRWRMTCNS